MADIYEVYQDRILKNGVAVDPATSFEWSAHSDSYKRTEGYGSRWGKDLTWVTLTAKDGDKIYIRQGGTYYVPVVYDNLFTITHNPAGRSIAYSSVSPSTKQNYENNRSYWLKSYTDPLRGNKTYKKDVDLIAEVDDDSGPVKIEMSAPTDESYIGSVFLGKAPYEQFIMKWCDYPPTYVIKSFHLMFSYFRTILPFNIVKNVEFVRYAGKGTAFRTIDKIVLLAGSKTYGYAFYSKYCGFGDTANVFENCKFTDVNIDLWGTTSLIDCTFERTNGPILHNEKAVESSGLVNRCRFIECTNSGYILRHPMVTNCLFRDNACDFPCYCGIISNCAFIGNTGTTKVARGTLVLNSYFKGNTFFNDFSSLFDVYRKLEVQSVDGLICRESNQFEHEFREGMTYDKKPVIGIRPAKAAPFLYNCIVDSDIAAGYVYKRCKVSSLLTANDDKHVVDGPAMDFDNMVGTGFTLQDACDRLLFEFHPVLRALPLLYSYYYKQKGIDPLSRDLNNIERVAGIISIGPVEQDLSAYSVVRAHVVAGIGCVSPEVAVVKRGKDAVFTATGEVTKVVIDSEQVETSNTIRFTTSLPVHDVYVSTSRTSYVSKTEGVEHSTGIGTINRPFKDLNLALQYLLSRYRGVYNPDGTEHHKPEYFDSDWHKAVYTSNYDRFQVATCNCSSFVGDGCFKVVVLDGEVSCDEHYEAGIYPEHYTLDKIEIVLNEGASLSGIWLEPTSEFTFKGAGDCVKCTGKIEYFDGTYGPTYSQWFDYEANEMMAGYKQNTEPAPGSRHIRLNNLVFEDCSIADHPKSLLTVCGCSGQLPKNVTYSTWDKPYGTRFVGCDFVPTSAVNSVSTFVACYLHDQPIAEYEKVKHSSDCVFESCYISNCPRLEGTKNGCFVTGMYDNEIVSGTENASGEHGKGSAEYDPYVRSAVYSNGEPRSFMGGAKGNVPAYSDGWEVVASNSIMNGDNDKLRPEHARYVDVPNVKVNGVPLKELKPISYFPPYSARIAMRSKKSNGSDTIYTDGDVVPFDTTDFSILDLAGRKRDPGYISKVADAYLKSKGCDLSGLFSDLKFALAAIVWFYRYSGVDTIDTPLSWVVDEAMFRAVLDLEANCELKFKMHAGGRAVSSTSFLNNATVHHKYVYRGTAMSWVFASLKRSTKYWEGFDGLPYCVLRGCGVLDVGRECLDGLIDDPQRKELGDQYSLALALLDYEDEEAVIREAEEVVDNGEFEARLKTTAEGDLVYGDDAGRTVDYGLTVYPSGDRAYFPGGYSVNYDKCTLKWAVYSALNEYFGPIEYADYYIPALEKSVRGFKLPRRTST